MYNNQYLIDIVKMLTDDIRKEIPFWNYGIKHYPRIPRKTLFGYQDYNMHIWIDIAWESFIIKIVGYNKEMEFKIGSDVNGLIAKLKRIAQKLWNKSKNEKDILNEKNKGIYRIIEK